MHKTLECFCPMCGQELTKDVDVPIAPVFGQDELICSGCGDATYIFHTLCPKCQSLYLFFSDIDIPGEMTRLAGTYTDLISKIQESLAGKVQKFEVPVPRRWSARLTCTCEEVFSIDVPLPRLKS